MSGRNRPNVAQLDIIVAAIQSNLPDNTFLDRSQILLVLETIADMHHESATVVGNKVYCPILHEIMKLSTKRCEAKRHLRRKLKLILSGSPKR